jgi:hypothetical protein
MGRIQDWLQLAHHTRVLATRGHLTPFSIYITPYRGLLFPYFTSLPLSIAFTFSLVYDSFYTLYHKLFKKRPNVGVSEPKLWF